MLLHAELHIDKHAPSESGRQPSIPACVNEACLNTRNFERDPILQCRCPADSYSDANAAALLNFMKNTPPPTVRPGRKSKRLQKQPKGNTERELRIFEKVKKWHSKFFDICKMF